MKQKVGWVEVFDNFVFEVLVVVQGVYWEVLEISENLFTVVGGEANLDYDGVLVLLQ